MQKHAALITLILFALPGLSAAYECSFGASNLPGYPGGIPQSASLVVQGDGAVEVVCDANANALTPIPPDGRITVVLTASPGSSANFAARTLGSNGPMYNLYLNPSRSEIWGDGTAGTRVLTHTFTFSLFGGGLGTSPYGPPQRHTFPLYGSVRSSLNVRAGPYADTITATLSY